jgi:hypothetical protein
MDCEEITEKIGREWDKPDGFLGKLRDGYFDPKGLDRLVTLLRSIKPEEKLDRRLVSVIWYIPLFVSWQDERVQKRGGDMTSFRKAENLLLEILQDLLGIP